MLSAFFGHLVFLSKTGNPFVFSIIAISLIFVAIFNLAKISFDAFAIGEIILHLKIPFASFVKTANQPLLMVSLAVLNLLLIWILIWPKQHVPN